MLSKLQGLVRPEGLGKLKKFVHLITALQQVVRKVSVQYVNMERTLCVVVCLFFFAIKYFSCYFGRNRGVDSIIKKYINIVS
jgi:hypothetical protein